MSCASRAKSHRLKAEAGVLGEQNFDSPLLHNKNVAALSHNPFRSDVHPRLESFRQNPWVSKEVRCLKITICFGMTDLF
jgi:hypothetical protein